jgi:hypothetical protein
MALILSSRISFMVWGEGGAKRFFNSFLFIYATVRMRIVHKKIIPIKLHSRGVPKFCSLEKRVV